jgi:ABC-type Co2+ transport system permease subunit
MLGFGIGLFLQALIFEPQDMVHLAVNTLSLVIPLTVVHWRFGKQTAELNWQRILKLDAVYYSGVTLMVAFWLSMAEVATPFSAWLQFAASYLLVVAAEPVMTLALLSVFRVCVSVRNCRAGCVSAWMKVAGRHVYEEFAEQPGLPGKVWFVGAGPVILN